MILVDAYKLRNEIKKSDGYADSEYGKGICEGIRRALQKIYEAEPVSLEKHDEAVRADEGKKMIEEISLLIHKEIENLEERKSSECNEGRWVDEEKCSFAIDMLEILEEQMKEQNNMKKFEDLTYGEKIANKETEMSVDDVNHSPIGLIPECVRNSERIVEIVLAIERFSMAEKPIPIEWVNELKRRMSINIIQDKES